MPHAALGRLDAMLVEGEDRLERLCGRLDDKEDPAG
jgi:hypothetical protein